MNMYKYRHNQNILIINTILAELVYHFATRNGFIYNNIISYLICMFPYLVTFFDFVTVLKFVFALAPLPK